MKLYLGKDKQHKTQDLTATHATVSELTMKIEGQGHKLYMDNFFTSPALYNDLTKKKRNCCGTVRSSRKGMPQDLGHKKIKLKQCGT